MEKETIAHIIVAVTLFIGCVYLLINRWKEVSRQEKQKNKKQSKIKSNPIVSE